MVLKSNVFDLKTKAISTTLACMNLLNIYWVGNAQISILRKDGLWLIAIIHIWIQKLNNCTYFKYNYSMKMNKILKSWNTNKLLAARHLHSKKWIYKGAAKEDMPNLFIGKHKDVWTRKRFDLTNHSAESSSQNSLTVVLVISIKNKIIINIQ